jgi:hypothetical protein
LDLSKQWVESLNRKQYTDIVFDPSLNPRFPKAYNLFRGWKWTIFDSPKQVNMNKFMPVLEHIGHVWAAGDEYCYRFILSYIADIVQHAERKNPVVLQIFGNQGDGKSITSQTVLGALFGRYHAVSSSLDEILGKFNARLCEKLLIVLDEVGYAQGWRYSNQLKSKFSNEKQRNEKKFFDAVEINDYSRHILESNHYNSVKAEIGDRRYCCLEVSPAYNGNTSISKVLLPSLRMRKLLHICSTFSIITQSI